MKLTKKLEAEILKAYKTYWEAYLKGDMKTFASYLADDINVFGTAASENFKNKKETLRFYKATADQLVGKAQFRNSRIKMRAVDENVLLNEQCDIYVLIEGKWTFYGHARISSILKQTNSGWKLAHQHASFPDTRAEEGEQMAAEKIKEENLQLREAVKRRTAELENKNRELEIESSLEKVRAQAMGMHKPDDLLNVCKVLFTELSLLGFGGTRNAIIHTYNDEGNYFIDYDYSDLTGGVITNIPYNSHPVIKRFLEQIRRSDEAFAEITVRGKELNEWKKFRKNGGQPDDPRLDKTSALYYYFHSVGTGDIGISTFSSINEEKLQLLKRFRNVFDLAYKRYTDITKAEAQAREAQIEASLEKVRGRAMAMHKSEELLEAGALLYAELSKLGIEKLTSGYMLIDEDEKMGWNYGVNPTNGKIIPKPVGVPLTEKKEIRSIIKAWKRQEPIHVKHLDPQETIIHQSYMADHAVNFPISKEKLLSITPERLVIHTFNFKQGYLIIVRGEELTTEQQEMVVRFAKVFEMTYRRFLDLQKAEAQAREAQIETGLERVRSKTMAMHKSEEVTGIAVSLNEELMKLGFEGGSTIIIIDKKTGDTEQWTGFSEDKTLKSCYVPYFKHPYHDALLVAWKKEEKFLVYTLTGEEKKTIDEHYFATGYKDFPESDKKWMREMGSVTFSHAFMKYGAIHWGPDHLTEEQLRILQRFSKVFEQSYTRFLDLQKAESQVREAQIEAALEKVRSRSLSMHKSEEMQGVVEEVFIRLKELEVGLDTANILIYKKEPDIVESWTASPNLSDFRTRFLIPVSSVKHFSFIIDAIDSGAELATKRYKFKEKNEWFNYLFTHTDYKYIPEERKQSILNSPFFAVSVGLSKNIGIQLNSYSRDAFSDEENNILKRFAKVFEQSYTRFVDLQKAEAQAREAIIEAALERVRSRSMAMHKSDDLHEVIKVVTEQLFVLDLKFNVANFAKINQDGSWDLWLSTPEQAYPALIHVPYLDHPIFNRITEEEAKGNDFYTDVYTRELTNIFFHHFFENTIARNSPEERKQFVYSSKGLARSVFQTKNIWFSVARYDITAFTDEENAIFKRFANVFEQAYTRFLDLQKAEAQAREADIELSLERVRAKTMAMQKPSEFVDIINIIGEQFIHLGFDIDWANFGANGFAISEGIDIWNFAVIPGASPISARVFIPYFDHPVFTNSAANINEFVNGGRDLITVTFDKQTKDTWLDHLFTKTIFKDVPEEYRAIQYAKPGYTTSNISIKDTWLSIGKFDSRPFTDEQHLILRRFAKAFGQANTRFLDLQKAEAQAREAQIEASLERVRSRAMAMQNSDELKELIGTVFTELTKLDIVLTRCLIMIYDPRSNDSVWWMANSEAPTEPIGLRIQNHEHPPYASYLKAWQEKKLNWVYVLEGAVKKDWDDFLFVETELSHLPDFVIAGMKAPERVYLNSSFNSFGNLTLATLEPLSNEHFDILLRFAKVFDLTYTRFNDLKQAEAQKREAQIELALERVRARTMAMHKSEELAETAQVLFQQLSELGGIPDRIAIGITDEVNGVVNFWTTDQQGSHLEHSFSARLNERTTIAKTYQAWKEQKRSLVVDLHGEELKEWIQFAREEMGIAVKDDQIKDRRVHSFAFFSHGWILVSSHDPQSTETIQILERFASVFNLTYRRFLDLQKAEAQAKEAQIEAALEKVRSRSLAMHKSDELQEVVNTVFERLMDLDIEADSSNIAIFKEGSRSFDYWVASKTQKRSASFHMPYIDLSLTKDLIAARESGKEFSTMAYSFEEKNEWFDFAFKETDFKFLSDERKQFILNAPAVTVAIAFSKHTGVQVNRYNSKLLTEVESEILKRFSKVFEQAYIRFLDLEKAEAQAKEAQIEASLERVRSKTMAMHNSQDVGNTVATMFDQLVHLGVKTNRCGILIFSDTNNTEVWTAKSGPTGEAALIIGHLDVTIHTMLQGVHHAWKNNESFYNYELAGDDIKNYYNAINNYPDYPTRFNLDKLPSREIHSDFFFPEGAVFSFTSEPVPEEEALIFKRFAGVFGQTYRRYLDLQKAEANAREAQIEAGLERVRARTMAMHSSEDVSVATATMFTELEKLGIENFRGGITNIIPNRTQHVWSVNNLEEGKVLKSVGTFNIDAHPFWQLMYKEWEAKKDFIHYYLAGEDKQDYFEVLNAIQGYLPQNFQQYPDLHFQVYYFNEGAVWTNSLQPHSEEDKQVMKRFTSVFSLTYRRYQDLKKAEAQAKEATIEAALERVRGKAMAMHNSNDLSVTTSMIITELGKLGIKPIRCGVGIINKETHKGQLYTARFSPDGDSLSVVGWVLLEGHPVLENIYEKWVEGEDYFPELSGDSRKAYYEQLLAGLSVPTPDFKDEQIHYGHFFSFSVGCLYAWSEVKYNDDEIKILKRFASIIDLTFRRYFELQKSETNAREAVKQAALDRVRAEIASMRTINDLDRITPLIWNELTVLGIPFIRCGVFIMDEDQQLIHTFLSTPDGKAIAAFHLPYDTPGNLRNVVSNWKQNKNYIDHWDEAEFIQFADILVKGGALVSAEQYLKTIPKGGFYLHFLPFLQGMLYVGNTKQLEKEEIELIQHVADAFSTAYARYEDFNKLEAAKQQVEKTLTDLKQAQTQLVQSEKMASLGELTAGIAHEIQNPLNFVNNFSEVSKELLDEMKTELETGNTEDAKGIADDVIKNLEKINHHGKRADAIVKSMLQHSRSSSGKMEPTDINLLADEYLRLVYHGLRAKDKSFNAKFETAFDDNIGKVSIISQDIGRVLVNLINNAFYAVGERKKQESNGYEPTVEVLTRKIDDKIEIKVKDNGNGIPQKVLDKIFQPFFTTKPTGQGTGLGLSLAYDIVTKGHNGELKVETKEGEGSEFIIQLPVSKPSES